MKDIEISVHYAQKRPGPEKFTSDDLGISIKATMEQGDDPRAVKDQMYQQAKAFVEENLPKYPRPAAAPAAPQSQPGYPQGVAPQAAPAAPVDPVARTGGPGEYGELMRRVFGHLGVPQNPELEKKIVSFLGSYKDKASGQMKFSRDETWEAMVAFAQSKGWNWKVGKMLEVLQRIEQSLANGDAVDILYKTGASKDPMGNWVDQYASERLQPVPPVDQGHIPQGVAEAPPAPEAIDTFPSRAEFDGNSGQHQHDPDNVPF